MARRHKAELLPAKVRETFEKIKQSSPNKLKLMKIKGGYFVYAYAYIYDESQKRHKYVQHYLGKINEDGTFVERKRSIRHPESFFAYLQSNFGGGIENALNRLLYPDVVTLSALRVLSMDSRQSVAEIAKQIGIPSSSLASKIRRAMETYAISKTVELRPDTFGYTRYLVTVKFVSGSKPRYEDVKALLEKEPRVQLVLGMSGDYDLAIYLLAETTIVLEDILYQIRSSPVFATYSAVWHVNYVVEPYGWFVPLRNEFFEHLISQKVWHRTKETPKRQQSQLTFAEYAVMSELNKDAGQEFKEIEEKYKLNIGSAAYAYDKLIGDGTIERATIVMQRLPARYLAFIFVVQTNIDDFNKSLQSMLEEILEETAFPTNKFVYVANVSSPYGIVLLAPIYLEEDLQKLKHELAERVKGITLEVAIATNVLVGRVGARKFDMKKSQLYSLLQQLKQNKK
ncbi:MAG: Lrp/AsnC family transcriptional regulator [Candidatus Micrarchaeia archaeon]